MLDFASSSPSRDAVRLILVDDDVAVRSSLKFALELENFQVEIFGSAEDLLRAPLRTEPGCLLIDYRLPGLNGLELLEALRQRQVTAPALLITTQPDRLLRESAARAGAPIVEKPLLGNTLVLAIRERIGSSPKPTSDA
jgi:two-component system response regulator FixJ